MTHVLVIDYNHACSSPLHSMMCDKGYHTLIASGLEEALQFSHQYDIDVVLMNSIFLRENPDICVQLLHAASSAPEVIIMTEKGSADEAEIAINQGAWDYIVSSGSPQAIINSLLKVVNYRGKKCQPGHPEKLNWAKAPGIVGNSIRLKSCLDALLLMAQGDANVLITGETGTGKELFATALHENSNRRHQNFVVVDCAALPETLVESTLFGHERGAFTGATQKQNGLIKQADGGTLFLDEVGELPLVLQKSFLRVLEEHRFRPIGGKNEVASNFRLVAATNRDLDAMARQGTFREDLIFRLRTCNLHLPPLQSRLGDIPPLVKYFISRRQKDNPLFNKKISKDFLTALCQYHWPGNVRELFNAMERSLTAAQEHTTLYPYHLPTHIRVEVAKASLLDSSENGDALPENKESASQEGQSTVNSINARRNIQEIREEVLANTEKSYLKELLNITEGDISQAMNISGLSRSRLYQLFKVHGIKPSALRSGHIEGIILP